MRRQLWAAILFCCLALSAGRSLAAPDPGREGFAWGVCGHPGGSYAGVPLAEQMALVKGLGAEWYRVDFTGNDEWKEKIVAEAARANVRLLPILFPPARYGATRWQFTSGGEFPGAKGGIRVVESPVLSGKHALALDFDLQVETSRYVGCQTALDEPAALNALDFQAHATVPAALFMRVIDATGQTHQKPAAALTPDAWQKVTVALDGFASHWGGANDGVFHQPAHSLFLGVERSGGNPRAGRLCLDAIRGISAKGAVEIDDEFQPEPPEVIYRKSYEYARDIAQRFRGRLTHYEMSNELDNHALNGPPDPDGTRRSDYDPTRYLRTRELIRGLSEGIRAGDPAAVRLSCPGGWLHFAFPEWLREDGVAWEVTTWHWYSNMRDPRRPIESYSGTYDVFGRLSKLGGRIWFTEGNRWEGDWGNHAREQAEYLRTALVDLGTDPRLHGYFVYELLDEPYFDNAESSFGLVRMRRDEKGRLALGEKKPAYEAVRAAIGEARAKRQGTHE